MDYQTYQYDPAGRTLLKVTGVLMVIFGVFGVLLYLFGLAAVIGLTYATSGIISGSGDLIGMGLLLAAALTELIAGILGLRAAKRPERAGKGLLFWGVLCLLLTLAGLGHIALRSAGAPGWELALGVLLGAVTPIVYLVAAARVRKGAIYSSGEAGKASSEESPEEDG